MFNFIVLFISTLIGIFSILLTDSVTAFIIIVYLVLTAPVLSYVVSFYKELQYPIGAGVIALSLLPILNLEAYCATLDEWKLLRRTVISISVISIIFRIVAIMQVAQGGGSDIMTLLSAITVLVAIVLWHIVFMFMNWAILDILGYSLVPKVVLSVLGILSLGFLASRNAVLAKSLNDNIN